MTSGYVLFGLADQTISHILGSDYWAVYCGGLLCCEWGCAETRMCPSITRLSRKLVRTIAGSYFYYYYYDCYYL